MNVKRTLVMQRQGDNPGQSTINAPPCAVNTINMTNEKKQTAHLGWARLLVDRYRDLVEVPAPTREDPGGGRHHFAPDDEDASEYENYHNPGHTY
jgi:hypothetical protein